MQGLIDPWDFVEPELTSTLHDGAHESLFCDCTETWSFGGSNRQGFSPHGEVKMI